MDPFCSTLGTAPSNVILLGQLPLTSFVDEAVPLTSRVLLTCQLVLHFDTLFLCMRAHANAQGTDLRTGLLSVGLDCLLDATAQAILFLLSRYFDALQTRITTMDSSTSTMPPATNALDAAFVNTAFTQQSPHGDSALPYGIPQLHWKALHCLAPAKGANQWEASPWTHPTGELLGTTKEVRPPRIS